MMDRGKVHIPPAWLTLSLKGDWSAPHGMQNAWLPTVLRFRVNENRLTEFTRTTHDHKKPS